MVSHTVFQLSRAVSVCTYLNKPLAFDHLLSRLLFQ